MRKTFILFLLCLVATTIFAITTCNNKTLWVNRGETNLTIVQTDKSSSAQKLVATKIVNHAFGQVEIPLHPHRVVVLDGEGFLLDSLLALGIKPVGLLRCSNCVHSDIYSEFLGDAPSIGNEQPSLEKILDLKPDLILGYSWQEDYYPLLSNIAPTVMVDIYSVGIDFKEVFKYLAKTLNSSDQAEEILAKYNENIKKFRNQLGEKLKTKTVSLLAYWGSAIHVYGPELLVYAQVMSDIGIQFIPAYKKLGSNYLALSLETLHDWDADFLFVQFYYQEDFDNLESLSLLKAPIWSTLKAVRNKQVYIATWPGSGGPIMANRIINDLQQYFADKL